MVLSSKSTISSVVKDVTNQILDISNDLLSQCGTSAVGESTMSIFNSGDMIGNQISMKQSLKLDTKCFVEKGMTSDFTFKVAQRIASMPTINSEQSLAAIYSETSSSSLTSTIQNYMSKISANMVVSNYSNINAKLALSIVNTEGARMINNTINMEQDAIVVASAITTSMNQVGLITEITKALNNAPSLVQKDATAETVKDLAKTAGKTAADVAATGGKVAEAISNTVIYSIVAVVFVILAIVAGIVFRSRANNSNNPK